MVPCRCCITDKAGADSENIFHADGGRKNLYGCDFAHNAIPMRVEKL